MLRYSGFWVFFDLTRFPADRSCLTWIHKVSWLHIYKRNRWNSVVKFGAEIISTLGIKLKTSHLILGRFCSEPERFCQNLGRFCSNLESFCLDWVDWSEFCSLFFILRSFYLNLLRFDPIIILVNWVGLFVEIQKKFLFVWIQKAFVRIWKWDWPELYEFRKRNLLEI